MLRQFHEDKLNKNATIVMFASQHKLGENLYNIEVGKL